MVEKDDGLVADPAGTEHDSVVAKLMRGPLGGAETIPQVRIWVV